MWSSCKAIVHAEECQLEDETLHGMAPSVSSAMYSFWKKVCTSSVCIPCLSQLKYIIIFFVLSKQYAFWREALSYYFHIPIHQLLSLHHVYSVMWCLTSYTCTLLPLYCDSTSLAIFLKPEVTSEKIIETKENSFRVLSKP